MSITVNFWHKTGPVSVSGRWVSRSGTKRDEPPLCWSEFLWSFHPSFITELQTHRTRASRYYKAKECSSNGPDCIAISLKKFYYSDFWAFLYYIASFNFLRLIQWLLACALRFTRSHWKHCGRLLSSSEGNKPEQVSPSGNVGQNVLFFTNRVIIWGTGYHVLQQTQQWLQTPTTATGAVFTRWPWDVRLFVMNHSKENAKNLDQVVSRPQGVTTRLFKNIWSFVVIKLFHYWKLKIIGKNPQYLYLDRTTILVYILPVFSIFF